MVCHSGQPKFHLGTSFRFRYINTNRKMAYLSMFSMVTIVKHRIKQGYILSMEVIVLEHLDAIGQYLIFVCHFPIIKYTDFGHFHSHLWVQSVFRFSFIFGNFDHSFIRISASKHLLVNLNTNTYHLFGKSCSQAGHNCFLKER